MGREKNKVQRARKRREMMLRHKLFYYVALVALLVGVFLIIGTDLGWFNLYQSEQSFWIYFGLIPVVEWIEKKLKNVEVVRGEKL